MTTTTMNTMTKTKRTRLRRRGRKRTSAKTLEIRAMLLALAMGGVFGGWAGLAISVTHRENATPPAIVESVARPIVETQSSNALQALSLPPIPTVQPPPNPLTPHDSANSIRESSPTLSLAPIPAVPQPVNQRPVARTRSSR